jgi:general secretion pathway protein H
LGVPPSEGFTLVEMVVVLFVLAIASAISLPTIGRGLETLKIRSEAQGIVAFFRYGRQQAITTHRPQTIAVDPAGGRLSITEEGAETPRLTRQISASIRVIADPPTQTQVTFSPEGFSNGGNFLLEGPGGRSYRISINPMTGRVINTRL